MVHFLATIVFTLIFSKYLAHEFKKVISLSNNQNMLFLAGFSVIAASVIATIHTSIIGNFFLHFIGGGVASAFVFEYLKAQFSFRSSWHMELILLFALVSSLGAMNELAEFAFDTMGLGIMSLDRLDTWRDILANTSGAFLMFFLLKTIRKIRKN